jgi:hypothetical protein
MNLYQHRQQVFQELLLPRGYNQDKKIMDNNGPKKFVLLTKLPNKKLLWDVSFVQFITGISTALVQIKLWVKLDLSRI